MNQDIFYKTTSRSKYNEDVSSSLFTSETPTGQVRDDITSTSYINNRLRNIHEDIMNTDYLPMESVSKTGGSKHKRKHDSTSSSDDTTSTQTSTTQSTSIKKTSNRYTSATVDIPVNYSETSTTISPYYSSDYVYNSQSEYSSTSSEQAPKKRKTTGGKKKTSKKAPNKTTKKTNSRKTSKKKPVKKQPARKKSK